MSGKQGRPSTTQPETAFDYRRYITLVQVIVIGYLPTLKDLAFVWGVWLPGEEVTFEELAIRMAKFVTDQKHEGEEQQQWLSMQ